jgi:hypothetical protein
VYYTQFIAIIKKMHFFTDILYLIRLPWSAVVKPAADLARNGFKVNKNLGKFYYLSVFIAIDSTFIYNIGFL